MSLTVYHEEKCPGVVILREAKDDTAWLFDY